MKSKVRKSTLATIAMVLFAASMAFAGFPGRGHSSQKSGSIDIFAISQVPNGPTLQAGTYKLTLINDSSQPAIEFYRDGNLVGRAPIKLVDAGKKIPETEVDSNNQNDGGHVITEVDLSG